MPESVRHAAFLAKRLRAMGIRVEYTEGEAFARGQLELRGGAFATLADPLEVERVAFYSLGHNRLKFCQPRPFFDLPAIEIARCDTSEDIERALRRAWDGVQGDLRSAREWLERVGSVSQLARRGTRLRLPAAGEIDAPCEVRSPREILLPSAGPLREISPPDPDARRYRPLGSFESANELDLAIDASAASLAQQYRPRSRRAPAASIDVSDDPLDLDPRPRVMILVPMPEVGEALRSALRQRCSVIESADDAEAALAAFHTRSFDVVFVAAHMGRSDGFELAHQIRCVPGVEELPIVIIDDRDRRGHRETAEQLNALAYFPPPFQDDALDTLIEEATERRKRRRFRRYRARFPVQAAGALGDADLTEVVARGGICLKTPRELTPGTRERYTIRLPEPLGAIEIDGEVVTRVNLAGQASILAGIHFHRFHANAERRWIRLIEILAKRAQEKELPTD